MIFFFDIFFIFLKCLFIKMYCLLSLYLHLSDRFFHSENKRFVTLPWTTCASTVAKKKFSEGTYLITITIDFPYQVIRQWRGKPWRESRSCRNCDKISMMKRRATPMASITYEVIAMNVYSIERHASTARAL